MLDSRRFGPPEVPVLLRPSRRIRTAQTRNKEQEVRAPREQSRNVLQIQTHRAPDRTIHPREGVNKSTASRRDAKPQIPVARRLWSAGGASRLQEPLGFALRTVVALRPFVRSFRLSNHRSRLQGTRELSKQQARGHQGVHGRWEIVLFFKKQSRQVIANIRSCPKNEQINPNSGMERWVKNRFDLHSYLV